MKDIPPPSISPLDQKYLDRCLHLARLGSSLVFPNPQVGALIVHQDRIIGEGFHVFAGGPHAEVNALRSVKEKHLLPYSTMYVSLEPCSHHGKTPPCVSAIIQHQIPRVVIGCLDPNPQVSGRGVQRLRDQGITVDLAPQPEPFEAVNQAFFINQKEGRPHILLKWAESQDGFIAATDAHGQGMRTAITGKETKRWVHKLRSRSHAIMVGRKTSMIDNPSLTTRQFYGEHPIRIVFDKHLHLPTSAHLYSDGHPTIILNAIKNEQNAPIRYFRPTQWTDMRALTRELYHEFGICSILIEGGTNVLQQFIDQGSWDEIWRFRASHTLDKGLSAPSLSQDGSSILSYPVGEDELFVIKKHKSLF